MVTTADILDGFKDIGLTRPAVAVLDPPQGMEFDVRDIGSIRISIGGVSFIETGHESQLTHPDGSCTPMQYHIEPHRLVRVIAPGHDQPIRLHRIIDLRDISKNQLALPLHPGLLSLNQRRQTFLTSLNTLA